MQIVSLGDNLHKMSKPVFWEQYGKFYPACLVLNTGTRRADLDDLGKHGLQHNWLSHQGQQI